jgi:hypothetical protein
MPGYSGTPLPQKLGLKPGLRVRLKNAPDDVRRELHQGLAECKEVERSDSLDFVMLFTSSQGDLKKQFAAAANSLAPAGMLWVSWPKKASGVSTDLNENIVREIGLAASLVDVKVCAVTEVWSGLKFVRRLKDRAQNSIISRHARI